MHFNALISQCLKDIRITASKCDQAISFIKTLLLRGKENQTVCSLWWNKVLRDFIVFCAESHNCDHEHRNLWRLFVAVAITYQLLRLNLKTTDSWNEWHWSGRRVMFWQRTLDPGVHVAALWAIKATKHLFPPLKQMKKKLAGLTKEHEALFNFVENNKHISTEKEKQKV